jgi:hypothetical protein
MELIGMTKPFASLKITNWAVLTCLVNILLPLLHVRLGAIVLGQLFNTDVFWRTTWFVAILLLINVTNLLLWKNFQSKIGYLNIVLVVLNR